MVMTLLSMLLVLLVSLRLISNSSWGMWHSPLGRDDLRPTLLVGVELVQVIVDVHLVSSVVAELTPKHNDVAAALQMPPTYT